MKFENQSLKKYSTELNEFLKPEDSTPSTLTPIGNHYLLKKLDKLDYKFTEKQINKLKNKLYEIRRYEYINFYNETIEEVYINSNNDVVLNLYYEKTHDFKEPYILIR